MQLIYIIAIPLVVLIFFIVLSLKTDWKEIDKHNRQYYVGGYHIYYDRKILREIKSVTNHKKKQHDCIDSRKAQRGKGHRPHHRCDRA
ncbi:MAG: hypothetical protein ACLSDX_00225 [Parabacteroides merdae]